MITFDEKKIVKYDIWKTKALHSCLNQYFFLDSWASFTPEDLSDKYAAEYKVVEASAKRLEKYKEKEKFNFNFLKEYIRENEFCYKFIVISMYSFKIKMNTFSNEVY